MVQKRGRDHGRDRGLRELKKFGHHGTGREIIYLCTLNGLLLINY